MLHGPINEMDLQKITFLVCKCCKKGLFTHQNSQLQQPKTNMEQEVTACDSDIPSIFTSEKLYVWPPRSSLKSAANSEGQGCPSRHHIPPSFEEK